MAQSIRLLTIIAGTCIAAGAAQAETMAFHAALDCAHEVPAKTCAGTGMLDGMLDSASGKLDYTLTFDGLSGPATAAHFHGPAAVGANAGVAVPITGVTSPTKASTMLTAVQAADLKAGKWYVNVHTAANPAGEIRGQVMAGK